MNPGGRRLGEATWGNQQEAGSGLGCLAIGVLAKAARVAVARLFFLIADELGAQAFLVAALVGLVPLGGFSAAGCKPPLALFEIDLVRGLIVLLAGQKELGVGRFGITARGGRSVGKQAELRSREWSRFGLAIESRGRMRTCVATWDRLRKIRCDLGRSQRFWVRDRNFFFRI